MLKAKACSRFEEKGSAHKGALWHNNFVSSVGFGAVNHSLNCSRLYHGTIGKNSIVGYTVFFHRSGTFKYTVEKCRYIVCCGLGPRVKEPKRMYRSICAVALGVYSERIVARHKFVAAVAIARQLAVYETNRSGAHAHPFER